MGAEALTTMGFGAEVTSWVEDYKSNVTHHDPPQAALRRIPSRALGGGAATEGRRR